MLRNKRILFIILIIATMLMIFYYNDDHITNILLSSTLSRDKISNILLDGEIKTGDDVNGSQKKIANQAMKNSTVRMIKGIKQAKRDFCVIANVYNPVMYKSRYESYKRFEIHMQSFDVLLITVELTLADQKFKVTNTKNPYHIQLRTNDSLWYKENLINIGIRRSPESCVYIAWVDLEMEFQNRNWVEDTRNALKKSKVVQLFDIVNVLGPSSEILKTFPGFARCFINGKALLKSKYNLKSLETFCSPGYAWASTKSTLLEIGGLFDKAIVGDADAIVADGFRAITTGTYGVFKRDYKNEIKKWQNRTSKIIQKSIGYIEGPLMHLWHGSRKNRGYSSRRGILSNKKSTYKPLEDVYYDKDGLLHFTKQGKVKLQEKIIDYFFSRKEDS